MTTLIMAGGSEGRRSCDSKCYNAKHPDCDCICGGVNHGVGIGRALENTAKFAEVIIDDYHNARITPLQKNIFGEFEPCEGG